MPFNSIVFIFYFLPFVLIGNTVLHFAFPRSFLRQLFLILCSFIFYFWSTGFASLILIISAIYCYLLNFLMVTSQRHVHKKTWFIVGIVSFVGLLAFYKYNVSIFEHPYILVLTNRFPVLQSFVRPRALLLGVSFFSFQAISYLIESYLKISRFSLLESLSYFTFFPKLLQGPIARFSELRSTLNHPNITSEHMFNGWVRFSFGLGKKVILADGLGIIANTVFELQPSLISPGTAWIGIIVYTFQIFLDFSGYTDMAIGIAEMLGIFLPENFASPYTTSSITEFWSRWHITLSRWLRDYIYIPLGGNRGTQLRVIINIMVIFVLSGLWHGTGLQYLVWGIYHGIFVVMERIFRLKNIRSPSVIAYPLTFLAIMMSWVLFRSPGLTYALGYFRSLVSFESLLTVPANIAVMIDNRFLFIFFLSLWIIFVAPFINISVQNKLWIIFAKMAFSLSIFVYAVSVLSTSSFSPFLYFKY